MGALLSFLIFLDLVFCLVVAYALVEHLKRTHNGTWIELGRPEFPDKQPEKPAVLLWSYWLTIRFVFSGRPMALGDARVRGLAWALRVLFVLVPLLMISAWRA